MNTVLLGVGAFIAIILALVAVISVAKFLLVKTKNVKIAINDDPSKTLDVPSGEKLLGTLASQGIFVPSACGGGGTCGQCRCKVKKGGR
jgi:Na+-transporting NADH:ubiquinone oxidoreductase subunit F